MPELIVIAGCTERRGMLDEYERQLAAADIPFFLESLDPLPAGANSITMARRIAYVRKMARQFAAYRKIVITDAWDVLFFGSASEVAKGARGHFGFVGAKLLSRGRSWRQNPRNYALAIRQSRYDRWHFKFIVGVGSSSGTNGRSKHP